MVVKNESCSCEQSHALIFACSGGADVWELADRAARALDVIGAGNVFCLAGIGGNVSGIVESTRAAKRIVVIDGCSLDCARSTLEKAGFGYTLHIRVTDEGFSKGQTNVNEETIARIVEAAQTACARLNALSD